MRKYLAIYRNTLLTTLSFRGEFFITSLTNLLFIVIIYNIWKSVYTNVPYKLNGMTFNDTFIYLSLGSSLFIIFMTWCEWMVSSFIISGDIVKFLIKPFDFQHYMLANSLGILTFKLITASIPTAILLFVVFPTDITFGPNILFFLLSVLLAFLISFHFDFIIGVTSFYTESIWGIVVTKEAIVMLLSGVLIPIPFFPGPMQTILMYLPFQAVYNIPLSILISDGMSLREYVVKILIQCVWIVVFYFFSRAYYARAVRVLTVAGG